MVAVVSGSGLGLFTSGSVSGNANTGRGGERVFVNTATGNLVVQGADESLTARGLDFVALRTYNSQGLLDDDNGDNWRLGADQRLSTLTGTVNTSGSTITKHFGDGARVVYTYNVARSRYESNEGGGAHDYLTYSAGTWTWTDGSGRNIETYDASLRIATSADTDGNTITYTFTGSVLTRLDMAGSTAQTVFFDYTGTNCRRFVSSPMVPRRRLRATHTTRRTGWRRSRSTLRRTTSPTASRTRRRIRTTAPVAASQASGSRMAVPLRSPTCRPTATIA